MRLISIEADSITVRVVHTRGTRNRIPHRSHDMSARVCTTRGCRSRRRRAICACGSDVRRRQSSVHRCIDRPACRTPSRRIDVPSDIRHCTARHAAAYTRQCAPRRLTHRASFKSTAQAHPEWTRGGLTRHDTKRLTPPTPASAARRAIVLHKARCAHIRPASVLYVCRSRQLPRCVPPPRHEVRPPRRVPVVRAHGGVGPGVPE
jgi:hypothetical protein